MIYIQLTRACSPGKHPAVLSNLIAVSTLNTRDGQYHHHVASLDRDSELSYRYIVKPVMEGFVSELQQEGGSAISPSGASVNRLALGSFDMKADVWPCICYNMLVSETGPLYDFLKPTFEKWPKDGFVDLTDMVSQGWETNTPLSILELAWGCGYSWNRECDLYEAWRTGKDISPLAEVNLRTMHALRESYKRICPKENGRG